MSYMIYTVLNEEKETRLAAILYNCPNVIIYYNVTKVPDQL